MSAVTKQTSQIAWPSSIFYKIDELFVAGANFVVDRETNEVLITRIIVPIKHRGKGYGSKLLARILKLADDNHVTLALQAGSYGKTTGGLSQKHLVAWYKRHGFELFDGYYRRLPR